MAIKLVVSNTVAFKVKGSINDAAGVPQPFDFSLTCERLDHDRINAVVQDNNGLMADFMKQVTRDWSGVKDEDGKAMEFSEDGFAQLMRIHGMSGLCFHAYMQESGAKPKN